MGFSGSDGLFFGLTIRNYSVMRKNDAWSFPQRPCSVSSRYCLCQEDSCVPISVSI